MIFFFFRFQSALLILRTTADTNRGERVVRDARLSSLFDFSSLSLSLSLFLSFAVSKTGFWLLGFFFHKRKKKEESLARTHTRVPIAHSHESSVTHLRSPQICWTKKKESSVLSLLDVFFPQNVILRKKTEKTHPKHTHTHIIPKSLSGSLPTKKRRL